MCIYIYVNVCIYIYRYISLSLSLGRGLYAARFAVGLVSRIEKLAVAILSCNALL